MRCLESFIHLCAAGMFDSKEINIMTLDTDMSNGNKKRVEQLIDIYNSIRQGEAAKDTFFSAKINAYHFITPYNESEGNTYMSLRGKGALQNNNDNDDLAKLFYEEDTVQKFQLDKGYRAQTHLGSMMMYTSIVDAATKVATDEKKYPQFLELKEFTSKLVNTQNKCRVFVFGSVFGGTGASSIPIIPKALSKAAKVMHDKELNEQYVQFGATLLTEYFTFTRASNDAISKEKVIADAGKFALNSQAALYFYINDPTVKKSYRHFYQIGWPFDNEDFSKDGDTEKPASVGGDDQKNNSHFVELMAAAAAYDFFTCQLKDLKEVVYLHRCLETNDGKLNSVKVKADDLFSDPVAAEKFERKLGGLFIMAHLVLGHHEGAWDDSEKAGLKPFLASNFIDQPEYKEFDSRLAKLLNSYLRMFAYEGGSNDSVKPAWIYQLHSSLAGGAGLFDALVAFPDHLSKAREVNMGGLHNETKYNWSDNKGLFWGTKEKSYHKLVEEMRAHKNDAIGSGLDRFFTQFYATIMGIKM